MATRLTRAIASGEPIRVDLNGGTSIRSTREELIEKLRIRSWYAHFVLARRD